MTGHGFKFVVGEMGQTLTGQADGAVPGIGKVLTKEGEFVADEGGIKGGVVGDERGGADKFGELRPDLSRGRFPPQHGAADTVYPLGTIVDRRTDLDQGAEFSDDGAIFDRHGADFNDPAAIGRGEAGGFNVDNDYATGQ